jgi:hypothetical protein
MSINTSDFKTDFEEKLEELADAGVLDKFAELLIEQHFNTSSEPFGMERAREAVVAHLMEGFMDTGWGLFGYDSSDLRQIQRVDEAGIFASDEDALEYVTERTKAGSAKHAQALETHLRNATAIPQLQCQ